MKPLLFGAALLLFPRVAFADDLAVTLAQVAIAEAGPSATADHDAVWHVLRKRAERAGWPIGRMARAYSSPLRRGLPAWVWQIPARRWAAVILRARAFLLGDVPDPCPQAIHWGDRKGDAARALAAGWHPVSCGPTANLFWKLPGRKRPLR